MYLCISFIFGTTLTKFQISSSKSVLGQCASDMITNDDHKNVCYFLILFLEFLTISETIMTIFSSFKTNNEENKDIICKQSNIIENLKRKKIRCM